jgi:SNF2 family DNA or RNA helicase
MAIRLFLTEDGNLELNNLEQDNFSIEDDGVPLLFPFQTIDKNDHHIVIKPADIGEVLNYILAELKKNKLPVELDYDLRRYWDNYAFEKKMITELKSGRKKRLAGSINTNVFSDGRKLLPHQKAGIIHALNTDNSANFSVPGSGKTQIGLGVFVRLKSETTVEKALVIGPASCFEPWEEEAKSCLRQRINIIRWAGNINQRRKISRGIKDVDLILITYQTACNDYLLLEQLMRRYKFLLILDESHYIKNYTSVRARMALRLAPFSFKRIILTGTPAPHSLLDVWAQFSFLWPSKQLLGDFQNFKENIEKEKAPERKLKCELGPFFMRTTKKELGLPEIKSRIFQIRQVDVPEEQRRIIELLELRTLVEARKIDISENDLNILRRWRSARIIRLLQAASNPALLLSKLEFCNSKEDIDTSDLVKYASVFLEGKKMPAKVETVLKIAKMIVEARQKVIIWTWFIENIYLLEKLLSSYHPLKIFGGIKPYEDEDVATEESRERNIHEFKSRKDRPILLANPAACAESISLHKHCQHAIYLDRNFNCGQFLQSMDRIHRVGMPAGATAEYHIPFINCAIERSVDKRLKKRQRVLYNLLNDPMPVLGIDEDLWVVDSDQELEIAYSDLLKEIEKYARKYL